MIRLRTKPTIPATLESEKVQKVKEKIAIKVSRIQEITDKDFPNYWIEDDVRLKLWKYQYRKCCYCERKRDSKGEPDIEHFRPKTKAEDVKPGYWWLAYDWDNLFFSCKKCNKKKTSRFPLLRGRRARTPNSTVKESPIFPHPVDENPEDFIAFIWEEGKMPFAKPVGKDNEGRGSETIKILGLDDEILAEDRGRLLLSLRALASTMGYINHLMEVGMSKDKIDICKNNIKQETRANNEYAGFRRAFLCGNGCGPYISDD